MSVAEKTCRTCGKTLGLEDASSLCSLYNAIDYQTEIEMALEEFEIWNLNISQDDGLPQKICLTCFDSFCQIHNFRLMCVEAQLNFAEMCTGLDIIIKDEVSFKDSCYPEDYEGDQTVTVQEHFTFPGDEYMKADNDQLDYVKTSEAPINTDTDEDLETIPVNENENQNEFEEDEIELKQYRCEFCMRFVSFDDPDDLNKHYNELHSSELPYPCPKCEMSFNKLAKRNSHARCHFETTLQCEKCGKKFRGDKQMMAQHMAYYHIDKDRECPVCKIMFEKISLKKYYYHMLWHDESKLLKCKFCDKKFIQSPHLVCHEKTHLSEVKFKCDECGLGFQNPGLLKNHTLMHERKELVQCPECPTRYFTRSGFKLHNQKVHYPEKKALRCDICDKTYPFAFKLAIHNHKVHGAPLQRSQMNRTLRPMTASAKRLKVLKKTNNRAYIKPFKCNQCDEAFVLEIQLQRHIKVHYEFRPHSCHLCPKTFKREAHLKLHVDCIHFNKKPFKCTMCTAAFVQRSHLRDHITIRHEDIKRYKCEICGKRFGTAQILKMHMIGHSSARPFICKICNKGFKQQSVLRSHMNWSHHWKNEGCLPEETTTEVLLKEEQEEDQYEEIL